MSLNSDIAIVGGGLIGPVLALACAKAGLKCVVVDAQSMDTRANAKFDGRAYALALASRRMLTALDIWQHVAEYAQNMNDIKVTDGRQGDGAAFLGLHFSSDEIEDGPMGSMLEDRYLRRTMMQMIDRHPDITHLSGTRVVAQTITAQGASLTLDDGSVVTTTLIVGADGRQSSTAARAGITRMGWDYKQTALVCAIAHEAPHNGIAHQFFMPSGPLAILPLPGNRSSIVWTEQSNLANAIHRLPDNDYLQVLRPRFGDFLGAIELCGPRHVYPLNLTIARSFTGPRVALAGDAAHGVHPIAGQGLNAGLRDVAALSEVLITAHQHGEDIASPAVLSRYAQWRSFDTAALATATDLFNRLFSNDNAFLRIGRDLGMGLVNALPSVRRTAIREAAGLNGDLPKLMQ
jgi:2-octaprenyl-6-methoxyphenol hydroxylase